MPHDGACGGTCRLVSLEDIQGFHVRRRRLVAQRQACDDGLPHADTWGGENALRVRMVVSGAHACRAAAEDLNTALGGDLKLTDFGPRLPQLLRDAEFGDFFVRRVRGECVRMGVNVWSPASPQPWFGTMRAEGLRSGWRGIGAPANLIATIWTCSRETVGCQLKGAKKM